MFRCICSLVLCKILCFSLVGETINTPQLHVCTYASKPVHGFLRFMHSCEQNGLEAHVFGMGLKWKGNRQKLKYLQEFIKTLPDTDVVMSVDSYDVLFLSDAKTILEKFLQMNAPFVISVEKYCIIPDLASNYPETSTPYRYINSGGFIGYVRAIKNILDGLGQFTENGSDQELLTRHFLNNQQLYKLDYNFDIFLTCAGVVRDDVYENFKLIQIDTVNKRVVVPSLNSTPCVIHGPGVGRHVTKTVFKNLYTGIKIK